MRTKQPGESALLLLDAVDLLARNGVSYAVIGAMAASVHGVVRASIDADAVLAVPVPELRRLEREFQDLGFVTELRYGDSDDPIGAVLALRDSHDNRVDLLVGIRGLDPGAFTRAVEVPFQGSSLRVVGLEDFIAMKLFAGGPQDVADAQFAIAVAGTALDDALMHKLAARFGGETSASLEALLAARSQSRR
jgi:predicted nucleotidyltransferase